MELQINELVSAIRKEGVDAAQTEADKIIANAKRESDNIISKAKETADSIIKQAEEKAKILKESAKTNAEHAKRDAMLSFKKSIKIEFEQLLQADIENTVDTKLLAKLIIAAISEEEPSKYAVEVSKITEGLKGELSKELKEGLEIKVSPNVRTGFKLIYKDGTGYFDCSDEELERILAPFFPELTI